VVADAVALVALIFSFLLQTQEIPVHDLHAHPLALQHRRNSEDVVSTEHPAPLPPSVIPHLQKRKRVSRNPSLSQVPQHGPASPHSIPLPMSPMPKDAFHFPAKSSISSTSSTPSTPMWDAFNSINSSPRASASTMGYITAHSRAPSSAAASLHSLSLSLSSESVRNAVYISDEDDLEVLENTLTSPDASMLDLSLSVSEAGNTATIYVPETSSAANSSTTHHRIGSAFLVPGPPSSSEEDEKSAEGGVMLINVTSPTSADPSSPRLLPRSTSTGNFQAHPPASFLSPSARSSSFQIQSAPPPPAFSYSGRARPLSIGSTNSRLWIGPSHNSAAPVSASPVVGSEVEAAGEAPEEIPVTPASFERSSGFATSPENSPYAPSFAFSARASGSSGTDSSHGCELECVTTLAHTPQPGMVAEEESRMLCRKHLRPNQG
jgi:hypothetical protein